MFGKPLKRAFGDVWVGRGGGGGGRNHIFCLFWSGFRHIALHPYPHYRVHFLGGGGPSPPLFWGWEMQKIMFRRSLGQWEAVRGQN